MDPVKLTTTIDRPRDEVFEYLADIANHAEFSDHFLVDWHLTREDSYGEGAGARFRVMLPMSRAAYGEATLTEVQAPQRLVTTGSGGRYNRVSTRNTWTLEPEGNGTRVEFVTESDPSTPPDRLMETALRARSFAKRKHARALKRLRSILESDQDRGGRATVSGGARKPASGFRL